MAVQKREGTQNQTEAIKSNSCYEADRRVNDVADPKRGNNTHCDRYDHGKTNQEEVDNVARFTVRSKEGDPKRRL